MKRVDSLTQEAWGVPRKAFILQMVPCAAHSAVTSTTQGGRVVRTWGRRGPKCS